MTPIPPWSDLPIDVLLDIFSPLDIRELIRVTAVCTSFGRAVSHSSKLQSPWFMFRPETPQDSSDSNEDNPSDTSEHYQIKTNYYSLLERIFYEIPLEKPFSKWNVIGSSNGWLIMTDEISNLHLLNPLNNKHIPLPPVITMDGVNSVIDDEGNILQYAISYFGEVDAKKLYEHFTKVILSGDPAEGNYIVMVVRAEDDHSGRTPGRISFAREGDECWNMLDEEKLYYSDIVFHNKLLYGVTETGGVDVWKITMSTLPSRQVLVPEDTSNDNEDSYDDLMEIVNTDKYIIYTPWGDILVVWRKCNDMFDGIHFYLQQETTAINIYRVDTHKKSLVEINNIGEHALFLGETSGCFSTESFPNLRANSVYFKEYYCKYREGHLRFYDVKKNHFEFDTPSAKNPDTPVTWITPNYMRKKFLLLFNA